MGKVQLTSTGSSMHIKLFFLVLWRAIALGWVHC